MLFCPIRKCCHIAKVSILLLLVVAAAIFSGRQWLGGKPAPAASVDYLNGLEVEYERQILEDEALIVPGLGEGGVQEYLQGSNKELGEMSMKSQAMNVYLSDRIAYNRTLAESRHPSCARVVYDAELPSASVIVIFHNEPYSVVVRTLWSVVNSVRRDLPFYQNANYLDRSTGRIMTLGYRGQEPGSPLLYLKEVILVDDNSTLPELKGKLSHYVRTRLSPGLVRIVRLPERVGLIRARLAGSRVARGDVMVFLDSHCEVMRDWLRPLLQRLKEDSTCVATPVIDTIKPDTLQYLYESNYDKLQICGFSFLGYFMWLDIPPGEKKRRGSDISPTRSPTMAGGLFAINREYFWEIGAYDEQMAGWGGENLEMSFRIWQCGGSIEMMPCSRVGHMFRPFYPYRLPDDTHGINTARMAEVWMDAYAELFYMYRPELRNSSRVGDVSQRRALRQRLHCKDFQWYVDHVYRDHYLLVRDVLGYGRFRNPATNLCLDSLQQQAEGFPLGVYPCHASLQVTQFFTLTLQGQLRDELNCAYLHYTRGEAKVAQVLMSFCDDKLHAAIWRHESDGHIRHEASRLCVQATKAGANVTARPCAPITEQIWRIDYTLRNNFKDSPITSSQRQMTA